jgi:RNA-binding protein
MNPQKTPENLTNAQKKFLRRLGHDLSPMVYIGKEGLTATVVAAVDDSLHHHELIKVKIINTDKITKHEAAEQVPLRTGSLLVQLIGKTLLLYRPNAEKKKDERIRLPGN